MESIKETIIDNIHDLILALDNKKEKIMLSSDMYDWLFKSNWDCLLSSRIKEYAKDHDVLRGIKNIKC